MNLDDYRDRMAAAHQAFTDQVLAMLATYGRTQTVITDLLRNVERGFHDLHESQDELKRLILDQGATLRAQAEELHALRSRLNGTDGH